jgi:hypothetical protein
VICGAEGTTDRDCICGECGDPLDITLFCRACGRRWSVPEEAARDLLADHGYDLEDLRGIVLKLDRCSRCLAEGETSHLDVYRVRLPVPEGPGRA